MLNRTRQYIAGIAVLAALAGCASNAKAGQLSIDTTAPMTPTTATVPADSSTTIPVTEVPPPTEAPTTTAAPETTTTAPAMSVEDQVKADYVTDRAARERCFFDPLGCDYASFSVPDSPMDVESRQKFASYIEHNLRAVPGAGEVRIRVEGVSVAGDLAHAIVCTYDTLVIYDVANPTDPTDDIVFDDGKASYRVDWQLAYRDGRWLLVSGETLERRTEEDLCGF